MDVIGPYVVERRNSAARSAREAELEDIVAIFDAVDLVDGLVDYLFVASDFNRMPKFGPEEINLGVVVDRQIRMEASLNSLSTVVQNFASSGTSSSNGPDQLVTDSTLTNFKQHMNDCHAAVNSRLDHLNAVCTQLATKADKAVSNNTIPSPSRRERPADDRSMNIVLFGVKEDHSTAVWRKIVDDALHFIVGRDVDIVDAFRIGRFADSKTRPIVIRLRSVWDKRLILSGSKKLKDFGQVIFVSADESVEVRRRRSLERLKVRAAGLGKVVAVNDGVLYVDGVPVFSLKDGKLS